jgi:PTS system galactitol-specific IIA component
MRQLSNESISKLTLSEELVLLNLEARDSEDVLMKMANNLQENNLVKESFSKAVIKREETNPTGLQSSSIGVALPHTDAEHVKEQGISIAVLKNPVEFVHMGSDTEKVNVYIVFMLAIKKPDSQLKLLQSLMNFFQKEELLETINKSQSKDKIINIIKKELF